MLTGSVSFFIAALVSVPILTYFQSHPEGFTYFLEKLNPVPSVSFLLSQPFLVPPAETWLTTSDQQAESTHVSHLLTLDKNLFMEFLLEQGNIVTQAIWTVSKNNTKTASCSNHPATVGASKECNVHYQIKQSMRETGRGKVSADIITHKFECNERGCWITEKFMEAFTSYWCVLEQGFPIPESLALNERYYVGNYKCTPKNTRWGIDKQYNNVHAGQPGTVTASTLYPSHQPFEKTILIALFLSLEKDSLSDDLFFDIEHHEYSYFPQLPWWTVISPFVKCHFSSDRYTLGSPESNYFQVCRESFIWNSFSTPKMISKYYKYRSSQTKPRPIN